MPLTTEQKINLLILAGFEPREYSYGGWPRVFRNDACLSLSAGSGTWVFDSEWGGIIHYHESEWASMQLETCPDKLIYQAIEATTG